MSKGKMVETESPTGSARRRSQPLPRGKSPLVARSPSPSPSPQPQPQAQAQAQADAKDQLIERLMASLAMQNQGMCPNIYVSYFVLSVSTV